METVELLIRIPDYAYDHIKVNAQESVDETEVMNAIRNGTLLPKGHDALIDADALKKYLDDCVFCKKCPNKNKGNSYCTLDCKFPDYCDDEWQRVIDEQPTIIEADKEGADDDKETRSI